MPITIPPPGVTGGTGHPTLYLPGTGDAVPTGIGSVLEYRGLTMNNRVLDRIHIKEIDGLGDADIRDARADNPGSDGEEALNAFYGGRTLTLSGKLEAGNIEKLYDLVEALKAAFVDIRREYPLIFHTGTLDRDFLIYCKKSMPIAWKDIQEGYKIERDFMVTLRASNPRMMSASQHVVNVMLASDDGVTIENLGNYNALPTLVLSGPMTDVTILNAVTGQSVTMEGVIGAGEVVTLNSIDRTAFDSIGNNRFDQRSIDSNWIELAGGAQDLVFTASGTDSSSFVSIFWRDSWI